MLGLEELPHSPVDPASSGRDMPGRDDLLQIVFTSGTTAGPSTAPLARIEGRYRIQFLIKSNSRSHLNRLLRSLIDYCELEGVTPRSYMIDMDPLSIM